MAEQISIITTTLESQKQAEVLSKKAVESGLAACAQVDSPILSHYQWKDTLEIATEYRIQFKLAPGKLTEFVDWLMDHHPYDCPQILEWKADSLNPGYTRWVKQE